MEKGRKPLLNEICSPKSFMLDHLKESSSLVKNPLHQIAPFHRRWNTIDCVAFPFSPNPKKKP